MDGTNVILKEEATMNNINIIMDIARLSYPVTVNGINTFVRIVVATYYVSIQWDSTCNVMIQLKVFTQCMAARK